MSEFVVYKLNAQGKQVWQYPAVKLAQDADFVRLEAYFNRDDYDLGYTIFKRDDRFIEYFYSDRWYNIFAVYDRDDADLKGWYCNVCRPAWWDERGLWCEDLELDVWVPAGAGSPLVLDEDEFAALQLPATEQQQATTALAQILQLAQTAQLPR